ncbi:UDP-3-O-acyl-N-acetylglucosamine deacetylase [Oceanomicrobium pacificus]|uniref:UDP-3-O-acyl-N-acetylglucosamine deacetylase n=1 Tax=Oceanomicrobium pacificus TaxID=2692916 RepID=A0A6B0TWP8_9RHOB|nr:UDP-3-O-acyl-N-acetylglucosamine deacetylase [Oceanomicrobium pacificus]MXU65433.1 UDP-3-O-acyl-N-acetylglucosamine deacetylase [Oceanomicrobium pacificus]
MTTAQTTLRDDVKLVGTGLHSGRPVHLTVRPAPSGHGIVFDRIDLDGDSRIKAVYDAVDDTRLCTRIANSSGATVSTIEHLMAAFAGCGIHNALVELDGPEVPILDGSSAKFVRAFLAAGVVELDAPLKVLRILKPVRFEKGDVWAELTPGNELSIDFAIDFEDAAIGSQSLHQNMANGAFVRELSDCRTFCRRADIEFMRANGLALGGGLENAIVVDGPTVLNPEGFRRSDECVRHKMLDALGDLYLAGAPILGAYRSEKGGHATTNLLLRQLFATPDAWELVDCPAGFAHLLPGADITARDLRAVG